MISNQKKNEERGEEKKIIVIYYYILIKINHGKTNATKYVWSKCKTKCN